MPDVDLNPGTTAFLEAPEHHWVSLVIPKQYCFLGPSYKLLMQLTKYFQERFMFTASLIILIIRKKVIRKQPIEKPKEVRSRDKAQEYIPLTLTRTVWACHFCLRGTWF